MFATSFERWAYKWVLKPVFFRCDPEQIHDFMIAVGAALGRFAPSRSLVRGLFSYVHPSLEQTVLGIRFRNPVGLAAGFDKNAQLTGIIPEVGFGFEEAGSVTGEPCAGNPKPRLWRLPKSRGLVVWYGLKNDGCEAIAARLRGRKLAAPLGVSVARTNDASTVADAAGIADYAKAFRTMAGIGDYLTVNISCPNTSGGEPFTDPARLSALLTELDKIPTAKPVLLKMPADISAAELDALVAACGGHRVRGFILSNLTKRRDRPSIEPDESRGIKVGGISGRPVFDPSNELISHLYRAVGRRYVIVGCGGIFSAADAYDKIRRGASLVQLITGMIFEGPQLIGEINRGLAELLKRDGYANIAEAVGTKAGS